MKVLQKYFLALVPPPEVLDRVQGIKLQLREEFGIKYALKSPAHITLKMPFSYNQAKEALLLERLAEQMQEQRPFDLKLTGVDTFGKRVIFLSVGRSEPLLLLQERLKVFCKRELHLADELSDRNFHPHMTIAFKDLKEGHFYEVLDRVKELAADTEYSTGELTLLKRIDGAWFPHRRVPFGG